MHYLKREYYIRYNKEDCIKRRENLGYASLRRKIETIRSMFYSKLPEKYIRIAKQFTFIHRTSLAEFLRIINKRNSRIDLTLFEQRFYSQNGEDGIIKIIFDRIKTTNKYCVEFGLHSSEGNTIYLKRKGWHCLWMDGNGDGVNIKKEFITAENINHLLNKYNVPKTFDLLSIDIDGNDYWVWKAIVDFSPRVVVIEYNSSIPLTESRTITYEPGFIWDGSNYFGASLLALEKLGKAKGYTLVACNSKGVNAFFVRDDLVAGSFESKDIKLIYRQPKYGAIVNNQFIGHPTSKKTMVFV